jgi:hypothetical protein
MRQQVFQRFMPKVLVHSERSEMIGWADSGRSLHKERMAVLGCRRVNLAAFANGPYRPTGSVEMLCGSGPSAFGLRRMRGRIRRTARGPRSLSLP